MKNREKFFVIFAIVIAVLTVIYIIKCNVMLNKMYTWQDAIDEQRANDEYSVEIEGIIKEYEKNIEEYGCNSQEKIPTRELAIADFFASHMNWYNIDIYMYMGICYGVINVVFYSFVITLFIYFMLTLEFKNRKQYITAQTIVLLIMIGVSFIAGIISDSSPYSEFVIYTNGDSIGRDSAFYWKYKGKGEIKYINVTYYDEAIIPTMYLIFLTGNIIRNIKKNKVKSE